MTFITGTEEIWNASDLVKGRYLEIDPPYLVYSTSLIRQFLGLDMSDVRVLWVIVFRRLEEIKYLEEELITFLVCFFCKCFCGLYAISRHSFGGRSLSTVGAAHRAREQFGQNRKPSANDNTGTMPFLALYLLDERNFDVLVPHLHLHLHGGRRERSARHHQAPPEVVATVRSLYSLVWFLKSQSDIQYLDPTLQSHPMTGTLRHPRSC